MWSIELPVTVQPKPVGPGPAGYVSYVPVLATAGFSKPPLVTSSGPFASAPWASAKQAPIASRSQPPHLSLELTTRPPSRAARSLRLYIVARASTWRTRGQRRCEDGVGLQLCPAR